MAYILQLEDGTNVINFMSTSGTPSWCLLEDNGLEITNPTKREMWAGSGSWRFGRELASFAYDNRRVTLRFEIVGDDRDDIFDKKTEILNMIEMARDSQIRNLSPQIYLTCQLDGTTNPVYFDVIDGELTLPPNIMSLEALNWEKAGGQPSIKGFVMDLVCKPFARGAEVTLGYGTVNPFDDGTRTNYISWNGSTVKGDVPGPVRYTFYNSSTGQPSNDIYQVWVGLRDHGDPSSWSYNVLEGEDATWAGSPSSAYQTYYSNGERKYVTVATTSDYLVCYWTIPDTLAADIIDLRGRVRVIAFGSFPANSQVWLTMRRWVTNYVIYPRVIPNTISSSNWVDMGVIDLLAWGVEPDQGAEEVELTFYAKLETSGFQVAIDALYMIPAEDYKYRGWEWMGYRQVPGVTIEDIGIKNQIAYGSQYKAFFIEPRGLPIHATPGQDGRLYFTWRTPTGSIYGDMTASVWAYHTPYYLDIRGTA